MEVAWEVLSYFGQYVHAYRKPVPSHTWLPMTLVAIPVLNCCYQDQILAPNIHCTNIWKPAPAFSVAFAVLSLSLPFPDILQRWLHSMGYSRPLLNALCRTREWIHSAVPGKPLRRACLGQWMLVGLRYMKGSGFSEVFSINSQGQIFKQVWLLATFATFFEKGGSHSNHNGNYMLRALHRIALFVPKWEVSSSESSTPDVGLNAWKFNPDLLWKSGSVLEHLSLKW